MNLRGMKTTVVGLGREGLALVRFLSENGALVTVSDAKPAAELADALRQVEDLSLRLSLGENRVEDTVSADVVFVSPGVPLSIPALQAARENGVPLSSVTKLFLELCPAPVAAITGSNGKTTTTTLLGEMFRAAGKPVLVAGNIGVPPLAHLSELTADHWVVLELSSFQLYILEQSPHVAAITNISPNHLDWHGSFEDYAWAKENIVRFQGAGDFAVLNHRDPTTKEMASRCPGRPLFFGQTPDFAGDGAYFRNDTICLRRDGDERAVCPAADIRLRGRHNRDNVLTACALASACGLPEEAMASVIATFTGVEHRLEPVAESEGVGYYNDSIATSPERATAGLHSFEEPIILIAGGRDKHLPLEPMLEAIRQRCKAVVLFGEMAPTLEAALAAPGEPLPMHRCEGLAEAVATARAWAKPGDVVLMSPGGTSFDLYRNYEERGLHFKRLVIEAIGKDQW